MGWACYEFGGAWGSMGEQAGPWRLTHHWLETTTFLFCPHSEDNFVFGQTGAGNNWVTYKFDCGRFEQRRLIVSGFSPSRRALAKPRSF